MVLCINLFLGVEKFLLIHPLCMDSHCKPDSYHIRSFLAVSLFRNRKLLHLGTENPNI